MTARVPLVDNVTELAKARGYQIAYTLSRTGKVLLPRASLDQICEYLHERVPDHTWRRHGHPPARVLRPPRESDVTHK